jgi:hypothetical protein
MRNALLVTGTAALAAVLLLCWRQAGTPPALPDRAGPPAVAASTEPVPPVPAATPPARSALAAARASDDARLARVTGRCVAAEDGTPLTGCSFTVVWPLRTSFVVRDPGAGADGSFAIALAPGTDSETFQLHVAHPTRVTHRLPREVRRGGELALGELRLAAGVVVRGRVLDTDGEPRADVVVHLQPAGVPSPGASPWAARTGEDGSFAFAEPLAPGAWTVAVPRYELHGERALHLAPRDGTRHLELVVTAEAPGDRITGVAVDATGAPVAGLRVQGTPSAIGARTDARGRFRLVRDTRAPLRPVLLAVLGAREVEDFRLDRTVTWGERDVQLVLRRTPSVEVLCLAADGAPLHPPFRLQCFRHPSSRTDTFATGESEPLPVDAARDGVVLVQGVRPGRNVLKLKVDDAPGSFGALAEFDVTPHGAPRQVLQLPRVARRAVRVVRGDGRPVEGSSLELVEAIGPRLRLPEDVADFDPLYQSHPCHDGVCWCRTATDAAGTALLAGPAGRTYALQLRGQGHLAKVVRDVSLDVAGPLHVVLETGATLRGTVGPAAALARLRPAAHVPIAPGRPNPALVLQDPVRGQRLHPNGAPAFGAGPGRAGRFGVAIEDDGRFVITGIPPGTWDVLIHHAPPGSRIAVPHQQEVLARVADLREAETRELVLDVGGLAETKLVGHVVLGNAPYADARVVLFGESTRQGVVPTQHASTCDANGCFTAELPGGRYTLWAYPPVHGLMLPCSEPVVVERGRTTERRFELRAVRVVLVLTDAAGAPAVNREVGFSLHPYGTSFRTDAYGRITIDPAPAVPFRAGAWPLHMADPASREVIQRGPRAKDPENQMIDLGWITPPADRDELTLELRLPR